MFSEEIKTKAMVACGRCCCICHKFCGNNMEVHHIKARADGGADTFENAIPLCFDCHAEVRQYDPRHPKGIKFSEKELIQHRDNWYKIIQSGAQEHSEKYIPQVKIYRQKGYQNLVLHRVTSGQELLATISGACALEYSYSEPQTRAEAEAISEIIQTLNDLPDILDVYEPNARVMMAFDLNGTIKKLDEAGFWLFLAIEKRTISGGLQGPDSFPTILAKVVRKDSPEIIRVPEGGQA